MAITARLILSVLTAAGLALAVTFLAGCAEVSNLRTQLIKDTADFSKTLPKDSFAVGVRTEDVFKNAADRGGE